jgi:hypothetical protein
MQHGMGGTPGHAAVLHACAATLDVGEECVCVCVCARALCPIGTQLGAVSSLSVRANEVHMVAQWTHSFQRYHDLLLVCALEP